MASDVNRQRTLPVRDITLGDAGWFPALVNETTTDVRLSPHQAQPLAGARALLAAPSLEQLWVSGALVGASFEGRASAVTGRNDSEAAFIELLRFQLSHVARLWQQHAPEFENASRMRWFTGAVLAAMAGEVVACRLLEEAAFAPDGVLDEREERRLFGIVGSRLLRRAYLLAHPPGGLPLHAGLAFFDTRTALRLASGRLVGVGTLHARASRSLAFLSRLKSQWIELVAGLPELVDLAAGDVRRTIDRQVRASALTTTDRRTLIRALDTPRHPARLLRTTSPAVRRLLVEQTVLAAVLHRCWRGSLEALVRETSLSVKLPATFVDEAQVKAAALVVQHEGAARRLLTHHRLPDSFESTVTSASDRLGAVAQAIAQEIRETGDLGRLLARAAQGEPLSDDERSRIKAQLADLARMVPALAIFAAPGGMLLLPAVLKLLPFDLRPSAFRNDTRRRDGGLEDA